MVIELPVIYKKQIILFLCTLLLAGQILDATSYAFFYAYVSPYSEAFELNPIINFIASIGGVPLVVVIKLFVGYCIFRSAVILADSKSEVTKTIVYVFLPLGAVMTWLGFISNTNSILDTIR